MADEDDYYQDYEDDDDDDQGQKYTKKKRHRKDKAKEREKEKLQLREDEIQDIFIFGYECKLFRDDEVAKNVNSSSSTFLIPWQGDSSLIIDRFDVRNLLFDRKKFQKQATIIKMKKEDLELEALCDEERYKDINGPNILLMTPEERETYREEVLKFERKLRNKGGDDQEFAPTYDEDEPSPPRHMARGEWPKRSDFLQRSRSRSRDRKRGRSRSRSPRSKRSRSRSRSKNRSRSWSRDRRSRSRGHDRDSKRRKSRSRSRSRDRRSKSRSRSKSPEDRKEQIPSPQKQNAQKSAETEPFVPKFQVPGHMTLPKTMKHAEIIEKTALFLNRGDKQMEIVLRTKQSKNPLFDFLNTSDVLHPYYKHLRFLISTGLFAYSVEEDESDDDDDIEKPPPDEIKVVEKTAEYVARHGESLGDKVQAKKDDPKFEFLNPESEYHPFYQKFLNKWKRKLNPAKKEEEQVQQEKPKEPPEIKEPSSIIHDSDFQEFLQNVESMVDQIPLDLLQGADSDENPSQKVDDEEIKAERRKRASEFLQKIKQTAKSTNENYLTPSSLPQSPNSLLNSPKLENLKPASKINLEAVIAAATAAAAIVAAKVAASASTSNSASPSTASGSLSTSTSVQSTLLSTISSTTPSTSTTTNILSTTTSSLTSNTQTTVSKPEAEVVMEPGEIDPVVFEQEKEKATTKAIIAEILASKPKKSKSSGKHRDRSKSPKKSKKKSDRHDSSPSSSSSSSSSSSESSSESGSESGSDSENEKKRKRRKQKSPHKKHSKSSKERSSRHKSSKSKSKRSRSRSSERSGDKEKDRNKDKGKDKDKGREREKKSDKEKKQEKDNRKENGKEKDKEKERHQEKEKLSEDKEREKSPFALNTASGTSKDFASKVRQMLSKTY